MDRLSEITFSPTPGGFTAALEFLHFSGVGGVGEGAVGELEAEGLGAFGVVDHFFAQQGDEVEAGGAVGLASPFGQGLISCAAFGAEGLQSGQEQGAVGGNHQGGLFGHGVDVPQLGLSDAQGILLVAVVDFDLPAVEVDLQQLGGGVRRSVVSR